MYCYERERERDETSTVGASQNIRQSLVMAIHSLLHQSTTNPVMPILWGPIIWVLIMVRRGMLALRCRRGARGCVAAGVYHCRPRHTPLTLQEHARHYRYTQARYLHLPLRPKLNKHTPTVSYTSTSSRTATIIQSPPP